MLFLYLDESGDLGFDFIKKKPSKFFTITILAIEGIDNNRALINAVKKTTQRKTKKTKELKGSNTTNSVKKYFYRLVEKLPFELFSISIDKQKMPTKKIINYNKTVKLILEKINLANAKHIKFIIDKSKQKKDIKEFNDYILSELKNLIGKNILEIKHFNSEEDKGIQAVDLFCYGFFQKYERKNEEWLKNFKFKIKFDQKY